MVRDRMPHVSEKRDMRAIDMVSVRVGLEIREKIQMGLRCFERTTSYNIVDDVYETGQ